MRCPHCLQGQVFNSFLNMIVHCPNCCIDFEREHCFFLMSIFIGYVLGFIIVVPFIIVLYLQDVSILTYFIASALILGIASPFIFRLARIIWLHLDELMDPRSITPSK
jgi:uncharacterized protein (DUF983 family)